ncbi:portal protein [Burkholderia phage BcepNazgul]|uniref:Portal protein Lambda B n=1 Tax=Burkholderia phage BcepNazgul TaxID=242861 RepID=Q6UYH9_9CAUD|nr:portal protein [Burkholderia phage BcepNazgul]AAQ63362.1 portal protein Lambda B [Burkholderia phage BcepNazgul]
MTKVTVRKLSEVTSGRPEQSASLGGGGLEGASRLSRETVSWNPSLRSPDALINPLKRIADARGRDMADNDGFTNGAVGYQRDSIVGAQYRLNSMPDINVIPGATEEWAEEYQTIVEAKFELYAESLACYIDNAAISTFTGLIRLGVVGYVKTGEVLATAEWDRAANRPYATCFQMVSTDRLSNPYQQLDTPTLRRGVQYDKRGRPQGYWIQVAHPGDLYQMAPDMYKWKFVQQSKPWGRRQVIHILEPREPDQSRGIADIVSGLKDMRMAKRFKEMSLQNAVINASYAAAIESELPPEFIHSQMSGGSPNADMVGIFGKYMDALKAYVGGANNIQIDGAKIPHLFPGTKLNLKPMGTPGGVGSEFEASLNRHLASAFGMSYEEFTRDFSKANYSSIQAGIAMTRRFLEGRKKMCADRLATEFFTLWLEEAIAAGEVPMPPGQTRDLFYQPLMKEALSKCEWIGASQGQIDQLKETQAAVMRIDAGLSTYEREIARLGGDFRKSFAQRAREDALLKKYGLTFNLSAKRSLGDGRDAATGIAEDPAAAQTSQQGE